MIKIKTSKGDILINPDNIIAIKSNYDGDGIEIMFTNNGKQKREYYTSDITFDEMYKSLVEVNNNFIKLKTCRVCDPDYKFYDTMINRHKIDLVNLDDAGSPLTIISAAVYMFATDSTVDEIEDMITRKKRASVTSRLLWQVKRSLDVIYNEDSLPISH